MATRKPRRKTGDIAPPEEVLMTLTQIMRGDLCDTTLRKDASGTETAAASPPKVAERARAAELLGKRYGLFTEKAESTTEKSAVTEQIEDAFCRLTGGDP